MRRKYLGLAIAAITALGPASAFGGDREIAEEIMTRLKSNRDSGALKDFSLDMKVDQGTVLFRGKVSQPDQKQLVLKAAEGIDGIKNVVDEVAVANAKVEKAAPATSAKQSLREMLVNTAKKAVTVSPAKTRPALEIAPGEVKPTAAIELATTKTASAKTPAATAKTAPAKINDQQIVAGVVQALGSAQRSGALKGFGVDVKCGNGAVTLNGRASSAQQRDLIVRIAQGVAGVQSVNPSISVLSATPQAAPAPVNAQLASARVTPLPQYQAASTPVNPTSAPVMGTPVSMNHAGGVGAPRYEAPNLPNYAWPGYAAYPNYAALTYPQQYSPSAWPYIGPFYPYPQVPMGWRKVSLEWDDGWWFLDFTDR